MGEFEISYVSSTSQYTETYLHENFSEKSIDLGQRETEENAHPTKNEFYNQFVNIIRVSTQNRMSNFKQENIIDEAVRSVNSSYIEEDIDDGIQRKLNTLEQKFRRRSSLNNRPRLQGSQMSKVKISPGSCFAWYIVKGKAVRDLIPDYEIFQCRGIFRNMIDKCPMCHEAYFGLAKILAHEQKYQESSSLIKEALKLKPDDTLYKKWFSFLQLKTSCKNKQQALANKALLDSLIREIPNKVELWWGLLELSLKNMLTIGVDIELPQYYASSIKTIDDYLGYLAWAVIFLEDGNPFKALAIIRELINLNPTRPEAYLYLWDYHYHTKKDYIIAEDISMECFLRITDYESYNILACLKYAKSLFKNKKYRNCFELLQQKFLEHPSYTVFLYQYGKLCTKSEDHTFNGSAIGALLECLRICDKNRYGVIYYWLGNAHMLSRHQIEAYNYYKSALEYLDPYEASKIAEIHAAMKQLRDKIKLIEKIQNNLAGEITDKKMEESKKYAQEIKTVNRITGDIWLAQISWKAGKHDEAIQILKTAASASSGRLTAYFILYDYLLLNGDLKSLKSLSKSMIIKCNNQQIPTQEWMKAHILYSDSLVRKQTPQKAILLLKCLAKVFPPLPFESIQYTKLLQKARTIQDLDMLNSVDHDTPNSVAYIESITNQRSPPGLKGRRLLIQQAIGGNSQGRKVSFNEIKNHQQEIIHLREKMRRPKKYLTLSILTEFENEEVEAILQSRGHINRNSGLPNGENAFVGFSICSDATFLYKIAKIAAIYNTNIEDGICAIHDYLILLVFERDHNRIDKLTVKALYYKAYLLCRNSNNQVARGIIQDISASLTSKKREKAQQFLEI